MSRASILALYVLASIWHFYASWRDAAARTCEVSKDAILEAFRKSPIYVLSHLRCRAFAPPGQNPFR
jgi:hypothetical protein